MVSDKDVAAEFSIFQAQSLALACVSLTIPKPVIKGQNVDERSVDRSLFGLIVG